MKVKLCVILYLLFIILVSACTNTNTTDSNGNRSESSIVQSSSSSELNCYWNLLKEFDGEYYTKIQIDNDSVFQFKYIQFGDSLHIGYGFVFEVDSNYRYRKEKVYDWEDVDCDGNKYTVIAEESSIVDLKEFYYITNKWIDSYRNSSWDYGDTVYIEKVDIGKIIVKSRDSLNADWAIDTLKRE